MLEREIESGCVRDRVCEIEIVCASRDFTNDAKNQALGEVRKPSTSSAPF